MQNKTVQKKSINLALQGGGSHGAFTWGVLDYFMEDGRVSVEGITGTSAGAMNAVALTQGYLDGGEDGARESLENFWKQVAIMGAMSPVKRSPLNILTGQWEVENSPAYLTFEAFSQVTSPYEFNPLDINPLLSLVESTIDFEKVRSCSLLKVFIAATNVHTGKIKVFNREELTADMVMASACLPHYFQAVEIDGIPYWDGGYVGNPPLFPLFYNTESNDIVIVQLNPIERQETPKSARDIKNRLNEICFNTSLLGELRAIDFVTRQLRQNSLDKAQYNDILMHRIEATEQLNALSASTKQNAEWGFMLYLRDIGRDAAKEFLDQNYDALGHESTLNLRQEFS